MRRIEAGCCAAASAYFLCSGSIECRRLGRAVEVPAAAGFRSQMTSRGRIDSGLAFWEVL